MLSKRAQRSVTEENTRTEKNTSKLRKNLHQFDNTCCKYSLHTYDQDAKINKKLTINSTDE